MPIIGAPSLRDTHFLSRYPSMGTTKNYGILSDFLKRISYKPGWKISLRDDHDNYSFIVVVNYEGYESEHAAFEPLGFEGPVASAARERLAVSIGKTVRRPDTRYFQRRFDYTTLDNMAPEFVIRYIIGDTIKQAEMYEFERWFKVEGCPIFEHKEER